MAAMKTRVSIVRCPGYGEEPLRESVGRALELVGGLEAFVGSGDAVFVKINHLSSGGRAERAVVTHPLFAREVLRRLKDLGARVTVGDDVATGDGDVFADSGYVEMCRSLGVQLINLKSAGFREVPCPPGGILDRVHVSIAALEADVLVNLPKLKTHSFTAYTGAVKNSYGLIPCGLRLGLHKRFPLNDDFSRMLVDVFGCARPRLTVMDAVMAMEGPGPSAGSPRLVGLVMAGVDAVAVDAVAQAVLGFGPVDVVTTREASARGLGTGDLEGIEIAGEGLKDVIIAGFRKAVFPVSLLRRGLPSSIYAFASGQLVLIPKVRQDKCTGCGRCAEICPAQAAVLEAGGKARILGSSCIHCLCCQEICPSRAIRLRQRPLGRVVRFAASVFKT
jgi:uncharacterized protein (DUF362 family)/Pyruvate/2-oxoacid:ferredoxin oxidoreductase delta subunit